MNVSLPVLYRDEHLLIVDKPSGLLVHRGWAKDDVTLVDLVRALAGDHAQPVHRLDRGTSGALVCGLNADAVRTLSAMFEHGEVRKTYTLLARGWFPDHVVVDHAVPRGESNVREEVPDYVDATTEFRTLARINGASLVQAQPRTGRLHQIRRHAKHLSHPILGDTTYGDGRRNRTWREEHGLHRLALHASALAFVHPVTQREMLVQSAVPSDLTKVLARAGFLV